MINKDLADKCRSWVEEYCQSNQSTPQSTQREVSNGIERNEIEPTCWFEMPYNLSEDYSPAGSTHISIGMDVRSGFGRFDKRSLDEIFGNFGEHSIKYINWYAQRLLRFIAGKEQIRYCDENMRENVNRLLSQLRERAILKAEELGIDLVVVERRKMAIEHDFDGCLCIVPMKLSSETLFHYHLDAEAGLYRKKTQ